MKVKYLVSNDVVDVGMRVFITSFMIENGIKRGVAKNTSEREAEVLADLNSRNPEEFRRELESAIHRHFKGAGEPQKIKVTLEEVTDGNNPIGEIPDIMLSSHMLQLEQMGKFINVGSEMSGSIKSMSGAIDAMGNEMKTMSGSIGAMGKDMKDGFSSMGSDIKDMGSDIKAMSMDMKDGFSSMGRQMKEGFELLARVFKH